jgi:hypothetical protein
MATVTKKRAKSQPTFGGTPYGNLSKLQYSLITNASGVWLDSDKASAVASGDKLRLGVIPAGTRIFDAKSLVSDAFTASATAKIGFEYVDGVDSTEVPQDDDYFHASLALDAAGRTAANNTAVRPVTLPKDAYLIATIGGANLAAVGILDVLIDVETKGVA